MKRILLFIINAVIGLSAFSQSPSRLISLHPAYPLAIGESTNSDGFGVSNSGLCIADIPMDSLPQYEIGQIFKQIVRYTEKGFGFYVKADSLHSVNIVYGFEVSEPPKGTIEFNEVTGRFKYFPAVDDYKSFVVTFTASNGTERVSEDVVFDLMPRTTSEVSVFQSEGIMPDATDYTLVAESSTTMLLNNQKRTAYSVNISGKDVIFDDAIKNKVWGLNGRDDIYELDIYAERLIIRSALSFPQTKVTVYAKQLIFEDHDNVIASINTTPVSENVLTDGYGVNGANAGSIFLNLKEFKGNLNRRLILNGAKGQSTNRNGTPGKGGDGGYVYSTIDVAGYCDCARGSGGVKYDVDSSGSPSKGNVIGYGKNGDDGYFELEDNPYGYLHPFYVSAVMRYANDAFINNKTSYVLQVCRNYRAEIDEYFNYISNKDNGGVHEGQVDDFDEALGSRSNKEILNYPNGTASSDIMALRSSLLEINSMLFRLEQGLDYFGNPAGWVPLLSFEVYLKNYDNEIDRAIPTLYMYYWLNRIDRSLQEKVRASQFAADATEQEIDDNQKLLNSLVLEVPVLQDEADALSAMIENLTSRIEALQNQLLAQATKSVKRKHWLSNLFGIGKVVAGAISFVPGWGTAVGTGLETALNFSEQGLEYFTGVDYGSIMNSINIDVDEDFFKVISQSLTDAKTSISQKDLNGLVKAGESLFNKAQPVCNSFANAYRVISNNKVSNSEVQAEYNKLIANSPEWNRMKGELDELNVKKTELINHMNEVFSNMTKTLSELSSDVLALDAFKREAFVGNSKRDLNAMLYLEKMKQRAKDRLLLYDYYLRKAYEYRLLQAYEEEEFNLGSMFDRFEKLGIALDSVVDVAAYEKLGSVYRERISEMANRIVNIYTYSHPEKHSTPRTYKVPKEKLDELNANGSVKINMYEMGFFSPTEENIRVLNLGVRYIKAHPEGELGYYGELSLEMSHSGISKFRKNGNIYCFNHMSPKTKNPHVWTTKVDIYDLPEVDNPKTDAVSSAISSQMSSILNYNIENIMLFSRPSVWSDMTLTKQVHMDTGENILIDSLVLQLEYDYTRRTEDLCNIDISASNDLMPYIHSSVEDVCGRSSGRGPLFRSFPKSNKNVTFTATKKYETYYFVNWTNRAGDLVSDNPVLTVSCQQDQRYIANYERRVPILNVPDTIVVDSEAGTFIVNVDTIGTCETEMDWYVSDSLSTWVHLNGQVEGVDKGEFEFAFDANATNKIRCDSLEIFAPETDQMSRMIYIVQQTPSGIERLTGNSYQVQVYPNPMRDYLKIEGQGLLSVKIYSLTGEELIHQKLKGSNNVTINVGNLINGMYIVSVKTNTGVENKKLLKM